MTQVQTGATFRKGRLLRSAATSAFALSALAGGVMLSGGAAKACGLDLINPGDTDSCTYTDTIDGNFITFTDSIELITPPLGTPTKPVPAGGNLSTSNVSLELTGQLYPFDQKQVDIDYNLTDPNNVPPLLRSPLVNPPFAGDTVLYRLNKTGTENGLPLKVWFDIASLTFNAAGNGGSVYKYIYSVDPIANPTADPIVTLFNNTGPVVYAGIPNQYSHIWVKDVITVNANGRVDNVINDFRDVPGPLPILGAGAAFGFSRKLRCRIKAASNA